MTAPTLIGIPVWVYFDRPRVIAILGEPERVDEIDSEPKSVVRNYAWERGATAIATYQASDSDETILGVRASVPGAATDRGLEVGSSLALARALYGELESSAEGRASFTYPDGQVLILLVDDEKIVELQLLSPSMLEKERPDSGVQLTARRPAVDAECVSRKEDSMPAPTS
jgi:hypothetical protein